MPNEDSPDPQPGPMSPPANQEVSPIQQPSPSNPMEALKSSLLTGKFSDLIITHGSESWKAHKVVICSQSAVLDAMISHLERDSSTLHLKGYDQESMKLMMEYFYKAKYTTLPSGPDFCLPLHTKVYILASELQITGLQTLSSHLFTKNLVNLVTDLEVYFSSVKDVYSKTTAANSALRIALAKIAISEMRHMLEDEKWWERFVEVTNEVPAFQRDIMAMMVEYPVSQVQVVVQELCEECGPRAEDDGYQVTTACKGCGVDKTLEFY